MINDFLNIATSANVELRKNAALFADIYQQLPMFANDSEVSIRLIVAHRLPPSDLTILMHDKNTGVLNVAASRINTSFLKHMLELHGQKSATLRATIFKRLDPIYLIEHIHTEDSYRARSEIARRIPTKYVPFMLMLNETIGFDVISKILIDRLKNEVTQSIVNW